MREIRCRKPKCRNTFWGTDGRRRFCDACRLGGPKRPWRYRLSDMSIATYKKLHRRIYLAKHFVYKTPEGLELALQRAEEAKRILGGKMEIKPAEGPSEYKRSEYKRCKNCAY